MLTRAVATFALFFALAGVAVAAPTTTPSFVFTGDLEPGQVDFFEIELQDSGPFFSSTGASGALSGSTDTVLTLFDDDGNVLEANDDGVGSLDSLIAFNGVAGTYTLGVSTYENFYPYRFAGLGGLYVLTVFGTPLRNVDFVESLVTPIPAAAVLFAAGVVGLGALRRRQAARSKS